MKRQIIIDVLERKAGTEVAMAVHDLSEEEALTVLVSLVENLITKENMVAFGEFRTKEELEDFIKDRQALRFGNENGK